jgi:hypothetical protein
MADDKDTEAARDDDRNEELPESPVPDPDQAGETEDDPEAD